MYFPIGSLIYWHENLYRGIPPTLPPPPGTHQSLLALRVSVWIQFIAGHFESSTKNPNWNVNAFSMFQCVYPRSMHQINIWYIYIYIYTCFVCTFCLSLYHMVLHIYNRGIFDETFRTYAPDLYTTYTYKYAHNFGNDPNIACSAFFAFSTCCCCCCCPVLMISYMCFSSVHLWNIVEQYFAFNA